MRKVEDLINELFFHFSELEIAIVRIFLNKKQFISSKRSKLYGQTELLANFGGLLGFFLGISLLSFVEIIYFFTLRTFLLVKNRILPSDNNITEMRSNVKINIISPSTPSTLNVTDQQSSLVQKGNTVFMHRRSISGRNDAISQGFY